MLDVNTIENSLVLRQAIQSLRPIYQAILALVEAGYKHVEIAEILGISRVWVSESLDKAYQSLRTYVE